jgi:hypothetical protein
MAFGSAGGPRLGCPIRHPIRLRHAVFRLWPNPWYRCPGLIRALRPGTPDCAWGFVRATHSVRARLLWQTRCRGRCGGEKASVCAMRLPCFCPAVAGWLAQVRRVPGRAGASLSRSCRRPGLAPPPRPASVRESGWAARFRFWPGRGQASPPIPRPNPALKRTRVAHWASWPAFPAAPLSSGVGRVQERAGARRAGRSAGKI